MEDLIEQEDAAARPLNLTDKRIEVLRWLAQREQPVYACAVADSCFPRQGRGYTAQMATRTGAGYVRPLAEAGLVVARWADIGWGTVCISEEGGRVLASLDREDGRLQERLQQARLAANPRGYFWWKARP